LTDLEKLLAYEEIRQLASRYAVYSDARDMDALVDLYIPDVRVGRDTFGHEALRADFDSAFRGVGVTFLQVGNHVIDLLDADHATGIVYCRGEIQDGGIDSDRWIIHAIQYHDSYERRDGHWLFVRRKHFLVYGAELGVNPLSLEPANWPRSQTGMGSHPHVLESWRKFWAASESEGRS
jgi:ketosteroid isomerase-like protein